MGTDLQNTQPGIRASQPPRFLPSEDGDRMIGISTVQFALRLALAIGMGAMVGLERQWRQRMAGTRTNALVAAGAAAFVMCGLLLDNDPSARGRIVSYVVSGVGFLGAGVIFKGRRKRTRTEHGRDDLVFRRYRRAVRARRSEPGARTRLRCSPGEHGAPSACISSSPCSPRGCSCRDDL